MTRTHLITGSFGAGKTTAIRKLMAGKPPEEFWLVVLNEFTEAGIDAIAVAEAATGAYDVRMVSGGCLCCVGELEFEKQLRDILRTQRPARLLIEPSGAGHAADIVDALAPYEAQGALRLDSIVCLIDAQDTLRIALERPFSEWGQIQSADVLLLSKPDLADAADRARFAEIAQAQFPAKSFLGEVSHGELPPQALAAYLRAPRFSLIERTPVKPPGTQVFQIGARAGSETTMAQLNLFGVQWQMPRELSFSRVILQQRLTWLLSAYEILIRRMKALFRTGPGPSWLVQWSGHGLTEEDSAYRHDSRLELVLSGEPTAEFLDAWRDALRAAVND